MNLNYREELNSGQRRGMVAVAPVLSCPSVVIIPDRMMFHKVHG